MDTGAIFFHGLFQDWSVWNLTISVDLGRLGELNLSPVLFSVYEKDTQKGRNKRRHALASTYVIDVRQKEARRARRRAGSGSRRGRRGVFSAKIRLMRMDAFFEAVTAIICCHGYYQKLFFVFLVLAMLQYP